MTVLDFILDGIEAELALERELGVRSVECDRSVLAGNEVEKRGGGGQRNLPTSKIEEYTAVHLDSPPPPSSSSYDFVFLHDRALSENGVAMMAKIIPAMGKTPETAPIIFTGELPKAKAYVVLGGNALKKWFPGTPGAPGQWAQTSVAPNVLVTYSPEYILRFGTVTPAVQKLKRDMWTSLKSVLQRV